MSQEYKSAFTQSKSHIESWKCSKEYQDFCVRFDLTVREIIRVVEEYLPKIHHIAETARESTVHIEYATSNSLARGFYCPSPVYDIIVGNVKRGKLIKNIRSDSKNYYKYGFDYQHKLLWSEKYYRGKPVEFEYLVYSNEKIWAFTLNSQERICLVTKEEYYAEKLQSYTKALVSYFDSTAICHSLHHEEYFYDEGGLFKCIWHKYFPHELYTQDVYIFERKNSYLSKYKCVSYTGEGVLDNNKAQYYDVRLERNA